MGEGVGLGYMKVLVTFGVIRTLLRGEGTPRDWPVENCGSLKGEEDEEPVAGIEFFDCFVGFADDGDGDELIDGDDELIDGDRLGVVFIGVKLLALPLG